MIGMQMKKIICDSDNTMGIQNLEIEDMPGKAYGLNIPTG